MKQIADIKPSFSRYCVLAIATGALMLPTVWSDAASAVTRSCAAEYHFIPTNFDGFAVSRPFRAEAQALGPNTARRHAYDKIMSCITQHWTSSSPEWPVSCRPVNGVHDYPFRRLETDVPAAVCAANPGHSEITVRVEIQVTGNTGCENPSGVNDWGITQLSPNYPVTCYASDGGVTPHAMDTDRPGMDYRNFDLPSANWQDCYEECVADSRCQAWTYVRPGVQGSQARCWLKNGVPAAHSNSCCVSGVVGPELR
jgi:hypothetical protein